MPASIEFNADKLIKKLDLIQKAYLPPAGFRTSIKELWL